MSAPLALTILFVVGAILAITGGVALYYEDDVWIGMGFIVGALLVWGIMTAFDPRR